MAMSQTKSGHWATQSHLRLSGSQRGFSPSNSQCESYSTHSGKFLEGNSKETGLIIVSFTKGNLFHSKWSLGLAIPFLLSLTLSTVLSVCSLHRRQHLLPAPFSFWFHLPKRASLLYYHQKAKVGLATPEEPGELLVSWKNENYKCQILRLGVVWRLGGSCWYCSSTSSLGWENALSLERGPSLPSSPLPLGSQLLNQVGLSRNFLQNKRSSNPFFFLN